MVDDAAALKAEGSQLDTGGGAWWPAVTFALFAYNQERFVSEAVQNAFAQQCEPMEIVLTDDCSTDRTYQIMQEMASEYAGPHRVFVRRNDRNLGTLAHINAAAPYFSGEVVVLAAGDDISMPDRAATALCFFRTFPRLRALYSDFVGFTDETPECVETRSRRYRKVSRAEIIFNGGGVGKGATYAYHRSCFFTPGPLPEHLFSEDRILPMRAALLGEVIFLERPTLFYRMRGQGAAAALRASGRLPLSNPDHLCWLRAELGRIEAVTGTSYPFSSALLGLTESLATKTGSDKRVERLLKAQLRKAVQSAIKVARPAQREVGDG